MTNIPTSAAAPETPAPQQHASIDALLDTVTAMLSDEAITEANRLAAILEAAFVELEEHLERAVHFAAQHEATARSVASELADRGLATSVDRILQILDDVAGVGRLVDALAKFENTVCPDPTVDRVDLAAITRGDLVRIRHTDYSYLAFSLGRHVFEPVHTWQNGRATRTLVLDADDCAHIVATRINRTNTTEAGGDATGQAGTVGQLAAEVGVTVDDIAEIVTGTDPAITEAWFTDTGASFAEQTLTPICRQDIVAHVDQLADLEGGER